jgi:hypothetical protein
VTPPPAAAGRGTRLDEVLPRFDVSKTHRLPVAAPAGRIFDVLERYDLRDSGFTRLLLALRGYGRLARRPERPVGLAPSLAAAGFVPLGGRPGRELVFGLVGKFWTPRGGIRAVSSEEFLAFAEEGYAKVAWNVAVEAVDESSSLLSTETRVLCFGRGARWRFAVYWRTIEVFSGAIRMTMLRGIRARALSGRGDS